MVTENERVTSAALALEQGDLSTFGALMRASHRSLRDDYQVSCTELEVMIEIADRQRGVYGSRLTGGGFGGCTISLVNTENSAEFQRRVVEAYHSATGLFTDIYLCQASQGVGQQGSRTATPEEWPRLVVLGDRPHLTKRNLSVQWSSSSARIWCGSGVEGSNSLFSTEFLIKKLEGRRETGISKKTYIAAGTRGAV